MTCKDVRNKQTGKENKKKKRHDDAEEKGIFAKTIWEKEEKLVLLLLGAFQLTNIFYRSSERINIC